MAKKSTVHKIRKMEFKKIMIVLLAIFWIFVLFANDVTNFNGPTASGKHRSARISPLRANRRRRSLSAMRGMFLMTRAVCRPPGSLRLILLRL